MSRPKGSKNKTTKAVKNSKTYAKMPKQLLAKHNVGKTVRLVSFELNVQSVLSHILDLFKASLTDAFRQYVAAKMYASAPASVEDFTSNFKNTVTVHGISNETLLESLDEVELEYLARPVPVQQVKAPVVNETRTPVFNVNSIAEELSKAKEPKVNSVFDSLDII